MATTALSPNGAQGCAKGAYVAGRSETYCYDSSGNTVPRDAVTQHRCGVFALLYFYLLKLCSILIDSAHTSIICRVTVPFCPGRGRGQEAVPTSARRPVCGHGRDPAATVPQVLCNMPDAGMERSPANAGAPRLLSLPSPAPPLHFSI